jgi:hypothetical protein
MFLKRGTACLVAFLAPSAMYGLPANPFVEYTFESGAASNVRDPGHYDGALSGGASISDGALALDGTSGYLDVQGSAGVTFATGLRVDTRFLRRSNGSEDTLASKWYAGGDQWLLTFYPGGAHGAGRLLFAVNFQDGTGVLLEHSPVTSAYLNTWVEVSARYDPAAGAQLYWDGGLVDSEAVVGRAVRSGSAPIQVGAAGPGTTWSRFDGVLDDVRIWSDVESRCDALMGLAAEISRQSLECPGTPRLTREQYLALFDAVECETGMPARVLKAFAFNESFGKYYRDDPGADTYPRQFTEPCDGMTYGTPPQWAYGGELWPRYYGGGVFPLFIIPSEPLTPPSARRPQAPQRPAPGPDCVPPTPAGPVNWVTAWPSVVHTIIGDDGATKGLGITQVTFNNRDIHDAATAEGIIAKNLGTNGNRYGEFYPVGGRRSVLSTVNNIASGPTLAKVLKDAHYNIRLLAELTLYKYEWTNGGSDPKPNALTLTNVCDLSDFPALGPTLCAGPEAPPVDELSAWIDFAAWSKTFGNPNTKRNWCRACGTPANSCTHVLAATCLLRTYTTPPTGPDCREPDKSCETNKAQRFVASSLPDVSAVPRTVACLP